MQNQIYFTDDKQLFYEVLEEGDNYNYPKNG